MGVKPEKGHFVIDIDMQSSKMLEYVRDFESLLQQVVYAVGEGKKSGPIILWGNVVGEYSFDGDRRGLKPQPRKKSQEGAVDNQGKNQDGT